MHIVAQTFELIKVSLGIKTCCEVSCCFENDTITTTEVFDNNDDNSFYQYYPQPQPPLLQQPPFLLLCFMMALIVVSLFFNYHKNNPPSVLKKLKEMSKDPFNTAKVTASWDFRTSFSLLYSNIGGKEKPGCLSKKEKLL